MSVQPTPFNSSVDADVIEGSLGMIDLYRSSSSDDFAPIGLYRSTSEDTTPATLFRFTSQDDIFPFKLCRSTSEEICPIDLFRSTSEDMRSLLAKPLIQLEDKEQEPTDDHYGVKRENVYDPFNSSAPPLSHPYPGIVNDTGYDNATWCSSGNAMVVESVSSIAQKKNKKVTFATGTVDNSEKNKQPTQVSSAPVVKDKKKLSLYDLQKAAKASPKKKNSTSSKVGSGKKGNKNDESEILAPYRAKAGPKFRKYQAENWSQRISELKQFVQKHGHCVVPHDYPKNQVLSRWAKRQRYQYKLYQAGSLRSSMNKDRVNALEDLGFCWDAHKTLWNDRFQELREFVDEKGHPNVPTTYCKNAQLATWVKCQRRQYKLWKSGARANINGNRVKALESLGFKWANNSKQYE